MRKRPKHEPTDNYFYLERKLARCMMIPDALNLHVDPVRTEMTDTQNIPISQFYELDDIKSKDILTEKKLIASLLYRRGQIRKRYRR